MNDRTKNHMNPTRPVDIVDSVMSTLFEGFVRDTPFPFSNTREMYRWLDRNPGYTGALKIVFPVDFNLDGITHRQIIYQATDYDASIASTLEKVTDQPIPYDGQRP